MKAIISSTYDDKYLFFIPICVWAWNKLGVDVICFLPYSDYMGSEAKNQVPAQLIRDTIQKNNLRCELHYFNAPENKKATYSQCSRLYAACLDLHDNEQLVVSDMDMVFLYKDYIQKAVPNIIDIYGSDLVPDGQFPMCYLSGYVKTWRDVIGKGSYQEHLDNLLGKIECENMRGNYWSKDQQTIWELLTSAANNTKEIDYIKHKRAREGTQFASKRYDRTDSFLLERLNPDTIDFHMPRPGYEEKNFDIIMQVLKYHYPNEHLQWMVDYCEQYKKLL